MRPSTAAWVGVLAVTASSCADPGHAFRSGPMPMQVAHAKLKSGATIILEEVRGSGAVSAVLIVPSGSKDDPAGKEGLAHLTGHLSLRSAPSGKVTQAQAYELLGATHAGVVTTVDTTRFSADGQIRLLPQLVSLLTQQLEHPLDGVDGPIFEGTRDLVASEQLSAEERAPSGAVTAALWSQLFPAGHPYARPVEGTPASLNPLTLADAQAFAKQNYGPSRATLVLTGDFDAALTEPVVLAALPASWTQASTAPAAISPAGPAQPPPSPPAPPRPPVVEQPVLRSQLVVAWSLPGRWSKDVSPAYLTHELEGSLDDPWNALQHTVRSVDCRFDSEGSLALMYCSLDAADGVSLDELLDAARTRLGHAFKVDTITLPNQQALYYLGQLRGYDDVGFRARSRAEGAAITGDPAALTASFEQGRRPDFQALSTLGQQWLNADRMRVVAVQPLTPGHGSLQRNGLPIDAEPAVSVPAQAIRDEAEGPSLAGMRQFTLSNGLKLLVVPRPSVPLVSVELVMPAGFSRGKPGAAPMTGAYLSNFDEGWFLSSTFTVNHYSDATTLRLSGGNGNLAQLLHNAHSWLTAPVDDRELIETVRARVAYRVSMEEEARPELRARAAFYKALVRGTHATPDQTSEDVKALLVSDLESWRSRAFIPNASTLIVTGAIDPEVARRAAEDELGPLRKYDAPDLLPLPDPAPLNPRPLVVQVNPPVTPGVVTLQLGCLMPPAEPKYALALYVVASWAHHRADRVWRQELGAAYRVEAGNEAGPVANYFDLSATVDPAQLTALLRTVKPELLEAHPTDDELALTRWRLARARSVDGASALDLARYFALPSLRHGDPLGAVEDSHALAEMPPELLRKTYEVCRGTAVLRLDGDEALVKAALKEAGLQN